MFGAVSNYLNQSAPEYNGFPEDSEGQKAEFARRVAVLKEFVADLGSRAGVQSAIIDELGIDCDKTFRSASVDRKYGVGPIVMSLPLLLFFDFVKDFQAENLEDFKQKLNDPVWSQAFADKFTHAIGAHSIVLNQSMREDVQSYVQQIIDDPEQMLNMQKFVILHELGHLQHDDKGLRPFLYAFLCAIVGLIVALPLIGVGLFISTGALVLDVAVCLGCFYLAFRVMFIATEILLAHTFGRSSEIAADQFAASAFPGAEGEKIRQGGIAFFEDVKKRSKHISWLDRLKDPHPTDEARIETLQSYQPAIPNNPQLGSPVHQN